MTQRIHENETRYNTADLEALFEAFYVFAKSGPPSLLGSKWDRCTWSIGGELLPFDIGTWSVEDPADIMEPRSYGSYNKVWASTQASLPGPWYVEERKKARGSASGMQRLRILSPAMVESTIPPMEALSRTHLGDVVPPVVLTQVLFRAATWMGVRLVPAHHQTGNFTKGDMALLFDLVAAFVQRGNFVVRIEKNSHAPKRPPRLQEERIQRLLKLYQSGGSAIHMGYKLWSLRGNAENYLDAWLKLEKHYQQLQKLGGEVERHLSPAEMLRQMADEFELKEKERLDAKNKKET